MKQILSLLMICVLLVCLFGCVAKPTEDAKGGNPNTTTTTQLLSDYDKAVAALDDGKVGEAFRLLSSSTDERAADLLLHFVWQPTRVAYENKGSIPYTYDENGYLKTIYYGKEQTNTYAWNADGTMQSVFIDYGTFWEKGTYTYQNGLLSEFLNVDAGGRQYKRTYTYDDQGNLLVEKCTSHYAGDNETNTYTYDENGRRAFKKEMNYTGKVWATTTYAYDETGRLIKRVCSFDEDYDGKLESTSTLTRTYNEKGGLSSQQEVSSSTSSSVSTYDDRGRVILENRIWSDGSSGVITYTYDNYGRSTGFCTIIDGEPNYGYSLTYNDENDTCLKKFAGEESTVEYQLFYYPHAVNKQLLENAGDWIKYSDPAIY